MKKLNRICVLGGTGFVGKRLVARLSSNGYTVKVLTRHRERHREVFIHPNVELITANIHDNSELKRHLSGMDAVINLVGILHESSDKGRRFQDVHVALSRNVIDACQSNNIRRLLHMSALKADSGRGTSEYLRTKGDAENVVHTSLKMQSTSFRPSVMFGLQDSFLNRFAALLKLTPKFIPLMLACPNTKFAPVYVDDVVSAFTNCLNDKTTIGKHYELCGPKVYTLKELIQYTGELTNNQRAIIGLGKTLSKLQAIVFTLLPGKIFTLDNYLSLQTDSICDSSMEDTLDIKPTSLESIAPLYLAQGQVRDRFFKCREDARR